MDKKIEDLLIEILEIDKVEFENLDDDDDLREHSLTSLNVIEFIVGIEEIMQVQVKDEDLLIDKCATKRKIRELINKYKENSPN